MTKKIAALLILIVLSSVNIVAQVKRPKAKPKAVATASREGTLQIEAGLVFKSGDTKPVARATFWLLKNDPQALTVTDELEGVWKSELRGGTGRLNFEYVKGLFGSQYAPRFTAAVKQVFDSDQAAKMTTGFDGKGVFAAVPTGDYFLFGKHSWGDSFSNAAVWNLRVSIKPGVNKLVLDNENAAR